MRERHNTLSAKGLHKQYGKRMVVKDVDVIVERGEIVGLLGPNGAGKTTSFYMITGMIKPTQGNVFLDKADITQDAMYKRARKGIGYLAQEPSIFGKLSVEDNLKLVLEMIKNMKPDAQQEKLKTLLKDLSVSHLEVFSIFPVGHQASYFLSFQEQVLNYLLQKVFQKSMAPGPGSQFLFGPAYTWHLGLCQPYLGIHFPALV
jgi:ABC-type branched-subunit amino acid transport system ATPase component